MKKTLKFDDGSILVGSSSTFTVTQEDQGKIDIFDMPSKYIWLSSRDILDEAEDYQGDTIYIGIYLRAGSKRYKLTVEDLQPFKYENIKCRVIEKISTEDATAVATLLDGTKKYSFGDISYWDEEGIVKIDSIKPVQNRVWLEELPNLTEVNLKGNINYFQIIKNPKLTKITCDQAIHPTTIKINNNPLLTSVPEFESGVYNNMKKAFACCHKLDMDTSVFQLSGDCSEMFSGTGITRLVINDAGITSMLWFARSGAFATKTLQEVVINGTLNKCTDFMGAFDGNAGLKKCDMSGVDFGKVRSLQTMFRGCKQLTTVGINFNTFRTYLSDVRFMFKNSGITDDIVFTDFANNIMYFDSLCSSYTKKLVFPADKPLKMTDTNYGTALSNATNLEYLKWDNIGNKSNQTAFNFTANTKLGTGSEENLQAFKNIFINAFDRKTAGYAVCTVSLADTQKALLTAEEITAFENKGYKIA